MTALDPALRDKYLVDPYADWAGGEGVPIVQASAVDLSGVRTGAWARFGASGAIAHVEGRCDFLTLFVIDIAPNTAAASMRHVYEELVYVVSGAGETDLMLSNGERRVLEWRAGTIFALPINATHAHRAGPSGARLASFNDFRYLMGLYRNEAFLFTNPASFAPRQARACGEPWCVDLAHMNMTSRVDGAHDDIQLADCALGACVVMLEDGQSTLARRQMQGAHLLCVSGEGVTLSFAQDGGPITQTPWRAGTAIGLAGMAFHQHVARGGPARFVVIELGSQASPIFRSRRAAYGDASVYASGAAVIARAQESAALIAARQG